MVEPSSPLPSLRIAVLIDADITQAALIENILAETSKYGLVTIRRIYGDWTQPNMKSWKEPLHHYAIQPIQQFRFTTGKNATDMALVIDAMDILYEGVVNGFCLVSSDSDYTRLATRIREKGLFAMGIGRKSTPRAFVNACEVFVYTENLVAEVEEAPAPQKRSGPSEAPSDPLPLLKRAVEVATGDSGLALLSTVGTVLRQLDPSFDPRSFGYRQLSQLVRASAETFDIMEEKGPRGSSHVYVRLRPPQG
jgi:uncharacterized LabA/DUF88 family protein